MVKTESPVGCSDRTGPKDEDIKKNTTAGGTCQAAQQSLLSGYDEYYISNPLAKNPKPYITATLEQIPAELRALPQWVAWKAVPRLDGKKPIKVPIDVSTKRGAQSSNPGTWSSFDDVMEFISDNSGWDHTHIDKDGMEITGTVSEYPGFVFAADDPYCGVDLDNCRNPATDEVSPWALKIIDDFNSYTELSQSRTGFHIIIRGKKPAGSGCKKGDIECYDQGRYFICTGEVFNGI